MKVLKNILIVLGVLLIVFNVLAYFAPVVPKDKSTAGLIGWYIGKNLMLMVGTGLLLWARSINKKLERRRIKAVLDSLPSR
jgi:hypothetical protein